MKQIKYYTPEEVAKICKVSIVTIYRWLKLGKIQAESLGFHYKKLIAETEIPAFLRKT